MKTFKQFLIEVYEYENVDGVKIHHSLVNGHRVKTEFDAGNHSTHVDVSVNDKTLHQSDINPIDRSRIAIKTTKVVSDYIDKEKPAKIKALAANNNKHDEHFGKIFSALAKKHGYDYKKIFGYHTLSRRLS